MARGRDEGRKVSVADMDDVFEEQLNHSFDHRGDTGKFGNIYKGEVPLWKSSEGDHELCIFPYSIEGNSPFRFEGGDFNKYFPPERFKAKGGTIPVYKLTVLVHYNIGINKDTVLCLRSINERCPICELRDELPEEAATKLGASKRALYNVFCFDSEKEMKKGIQVWEAPHASIEDVLSELYKDRRGNLRLFTDPRKGWNILFERKGTGLSTEYRRVEIAERRKEDEFTQEEFGELFDQVINFEEMVEIKSQKEIESMLSGMDMSGDGEKYPNDEGRRRDSREGESNGSPRFRGDRGRERAPDKEPERGRDRGKGEPVKEKGGDSSGEIPEEYKKCFGVDYQTIPACEDCPQDVWEACMKETEKRSAPKEETRGRGGFRRR